VNRFNLTFRGEILDGHDPKQARARFGKWYGVDDPARLDKFFSGDTIILRRDLDLKTAADCYRSLQEAGINSELVKIISRDTPPPPDASQTGNALKAALEKEAEARRLEKEEAAKRAAEEAERKRLAEEEAARIKAEKEEARRKAAEEAARVRAEKKRLEAERQARLKAEKEEAQRKAAEEAAKRAAEEAERKRLAEEEAARIKAEKEEARRKAADEAARIKAEKEEARRKAAEEAARVRAEKKRLEAELQARLKVKKEEARRKAAEEAAKRAAEEAERKARLKVEKEEARRKAVQEAAQLKAEKEEARRQEAEAAAQRAAEEAERNRLADEAAKRLKAEKEEVWRKAAEESARLTEENQRQKAERKAQQQAQREETRLEEARKSAERQAEEAERKRIAKIEAEEEASRLKAEKEEAARARAEKKRQDAEAKRLSEEQAARAREELQQAKRRASEEAARAQAEEKRREEERKQKAEEEKKQQQKALLEQREAMEALAIRRAAQELPKQAARAGATNQPTTPARKAQVGSPNLYSLVPFRNNAAIRQRAARAREQMHRALSRSLLALGAGLLLGALYLSFEPPHLVEGVEGVATNASGDLTLLAGNTLLRHDRSGTAEDSVELDDLDVAAPLAFEPSGTLLVAAGPASDRLDSPPLLRCEPATASCLEFAPVLRGKKLDDFAVHPLSGVVFTADSESGELLKIGPEGQLQDHAALIMRPETVLKLDSGLLFMSSPLGTAISVLRYEQGAFARQLDEILLLPPEAVLAKQTRIQDFTRAGDFWWVSLSNPATGSAGLYRYDAQWAYSGQAALPPGISPRKLTAWGNRLLVSDPTHLALARFSGSGQAEALFQSTSLESLANQQESLSHLSEFAWATALQILALLSLFTLALGYWHWLRSRVYRTSRESGAEPLDTIIDSVSWIAPVTQRRAKLLRSALCYTAIAVVPLVFAAYQGAPPLLLTVLSLTAAGPGFTLLLLRRRPTGHIGRTGEQLVLVDHQGLYHIGAQSRIHYRGSVLLIDDVVVYSGSKFLPAFSPRQFREQILPLRNTGVKIDPTTIAVKLMQSRHPLALGGLATLAGLVASLVLLLPHLL
jgi:hypothetical protein